MKDEILEEYFTSIKNDFTQLEERFEKRFNEQENWLQQIARNMATVLEIVSSDNSFLRDTRLNIMDHEKRISKLEQRVA